MSKSLAIFIMVAAMALFVTGQAAAQVESTKIVDFSKDVDVTADKTITITKDIDIANDVTDEEVNQSGNFDVLGGVYFGELDLEMEESEVIIKHFQFDDEATSSWSTSGTGVMNIAEQVQGGSGNTANIEQNDTTLFPNVMNVALQYQFGDGNFADIPTQNACTDQMNNFAKQVQVGSGNTAIGLQD